MLNSNGNITLIIDTPSGLTSHDWHDTVKDLAPGEYAWKGGKWKLTKRESRREEDNGL